MTRVIVHLDVFHMGRLFDTLNLPDVAAVAEDVCVLSHSACITLEVHGVHLIVTNQGLEQANVRQGEFVAGEELSVSQILVKLYK